MKKYIAFGVAATLWATLAGTAAAEGHVGLAAGPSHFKVNCAGVSRCDASDVGVKFFGGYRYTPMVAGELAYIDFGKSVSTGTQSGFGLEGTLRAYALVANVALRAPLAQDVSGIARLGLARVRGSLEQRADGVVIATEARASLQPYLGVGLQYTLKKNVSLDLGIDMTRAKLSNGSGGSTTSTVRLANAGITYGF